MGKLLRNVRIQHAEAMFTIYLMIDDVLLIHNRSAVYDVQACRKDG